MLIWWCPWFSRLEGVPGCREQRRGCLQEDDIPWLVLGVDGETFSGAAHLGHLPSAPALSLLCSSWREEKKNLSDWKSCPEEWQKAPEGSSPGSTDIYWEYLHIWWRFFCFEGVTSFLNFTQREWGGRVGTVGAGFAVLGKWVGHLVLCHLQLLRLHQGPNQSKCFAASCSSARKAGVSNNKVGWDQLENYRKYYWEWCRNEWNSLT